MHHQYTFRLSPSRQKSDIIFTEHKQLFNEAIETVNAGIAFTRDCKQLTLTHIGEKEITINLTSQKPLANPSRSLSGLTRYLIAKYPETFEPYIYNKTLFNIRILSQESTAPSKNNFSMSNEEIIKEIVDLLYTYPNTRDVKAAKSQIVEILRPFVEKGI